MKTYRHALRLFAVVFAVHAAGCAGGSTGTGTAGTSGGGTPGSAGTTGAAGMTGSAGTTAAAGTTGAAGTSATAGMTGSAGTSATAGTTGGAGTTASAGTTGNAGTTGSAGVTGVAGRGGTTGAAGRGGTTGGGGSGGAPAGCGSLPFCDTFESTAVGAAPDASKWTIIKINGGENGSATIDSIGAHGSSRSVKVVGAGSRFWLRNSSVIGTLGNVVHVRFWIRFMSAPASGHSAFFATSPTMVDVYNDQPQLRLGTQAATGAGALHWNTDSDAANLPDISPQGDALSVRPMAGTWYCMELTINRMNGHLSVEIDGQNVPGLANDGTPTSNIDQQWLSNNTSFMRYMMLAEFSLGWRDFGSGPMTLWYDDVALSAAPIGCN